MLSKELARYLVKLYKKTDELYIALNTKQTFEDELENEILMEVISDLEEILFGEEV